MSEARFKNLEKIIESVERSYDQLKAWEENGVSQEIESQIRKTIEQLETILESLDRQIEKLEDEI